MDCDSRFSRITRPVAAAALTAVLAGSLLVAGPEARDGAQANQTPSATGSPCVIVKHKGTVGRRLIFTALIGVPIAPGSKYDLVDSMNFHAEKVAFKGRELEKLQAEGVRVMVLEKKYTQADLESARNSCREPQTQERMQ